MARLGASTVHRELESGSPFAATLFLIWLAFRGLAGMLCMWRGAGKCLFTASALM